MTPLVVPLDPAEAGQLTLDEWDRLVVAGTVAFEADTHPLAERLEAEGIEVSMAWDGLSAVGAVVCAPVSPLIEKLAAEGAEVTSGVAVAPDPLSAVRGAYVGRRAASSFGGLVLTMARLRGRDGCPWDAKQTHESLQQHLLEETHEVLEAIDRGDDGRDLEEELGDLLLQVVFHAELGAEEGRFDIAGVADAIVAKLVRRHPHVFGDVEVANANEVIRNWEAIKRGEKPASDVPEDPYAGIPASLPALVMAAKSFKRAQGRGFSIDEDQARLRAAEALEAGELGSALLWTVALARERNVDPEGALRRAVTSFRTEWTA